MLRREGWKYGFEAGRCLVCGFRHMPPTRVCLRCKSVDQMEPERLADTKGVVATFAIDHLAFSMSPPTVGVVVDFDGGGRYRCELTDADAAHGRDRQPGGDDLPALLHRRGVHNYFWKARPVAGGRGRPAPAKEA